MEEAFIMATSLSVLILEDDPNVVRLCTRILSGLDMGLLPISVGTVAEALAQMRSKEFALFISDLRLPDGKGIAAITEFLKLRPETPAIVMTGSPNVENKETAMRLGVRAYFNKPFEMDVFRAAVVSALRTPASP